jgi:cation diffusion facilitator CzcD-associated flavoprotein CzcO
MMILMCTAGFPEDPTAEEETLEFDGVCICTGTNNWPCLPKFDGTTHT